MPKLICSLVLSATVSSVFALTNNETELHRAASIGDVAKVRAVLQKFDKKKDNVNATGSERNQYTERSGWTALFLAAVNGHSEAVKVLLAAGADAAMRIDEGFGDSHCFLADVRDHPEILELFLKAKAASACPDMFLTLDDKVFAARLLASGLDPNATIFDTPLLATAVREEKADHVQLLIEYKANVNFRFAATAISDDDKGKSVLDLALKTNNEGIIKLLKAAGAK